MKLSLTLLFIILFFLSCSKECKVPQEAKLLFDFLPYTYLKKSSFDALPGFQNERYDEIVDEFLNNCQTKKAKKIYGKLCEEAKGTLNSKFFLTENFRPYLIYNDANSSDGLLTGYYEAEIHASKEKSNKYKYPLYETPKDLITVDLSSIYPELKSYRLRGRVVGNRVVPYDTRAESKKSMLNADIICYCDSKIDKFFLEIQGSGRVQLDDNSTIFVGYDNQNGHKYRAIGQYLVKIKALRLEDISLQSIKTWLENHPSRVDEVLNYNNSMIYFKERKQGATGALGLELHAKRAVAVDPKYIPLGSLLYMHAEGVDTNFSRAILAEDTGGAIKGAVRADLFLGTGEEALKIAGKLKSKLKLWILLPKIVQEKKYEQIIRKI